MSRRPSNVLHGSEQDALLGTMILLEHSVLQKVLNSEEMLVLATCDRKDPGS